MRVLSGPVHVLVAMLLLAGCLTDRTSSGGTDGEAGDGGVGGDDYADQGEVGEVGEAGDEVGEADSGEDDEGDDDSGEDTGPPPLGPPDVDILFVIDNSGSMGEEQALLASAIPILPEILEDAGIDYRIGITTTDNGNPWCSGTTPEGGALRLSSCRSRLEEFFLGGDPYTDHQAACTDWCILDSIDILPTATDVDPTPKPHPWVESIDGETNLGPGVLPDIALQCFIPQGINGCGFEAHLESMYKGLKRAEDSNEASYGFLRKEAHLLVIFVSDELDCSYQIAYDEIFKPEGNRVFWSDPDAAYPTSAVCFNAGVTCSGGPGTYDKCSAENKDVNGEPTGDGTAVLHSVSRYTDFLGGLEDQKHEASGASVLVAGLLGVPGGYADGQEIVYQDSTDPQFQGDFGIGPGCSSSAGLALPPVRVREVAEALSDGHRNLHSVCSSSYADHLLRIVEVLFSYIG